MQQQTPPQGRLFPDPPQEQQTAPRFSSNTGTQPYEPQLRMQQTGAYPMYNSARYSTGSLQTLHGQPVQTLPPMATMPTAQAYQAAMQQSQPAVQAQQGNPMIVQTVQGTPVLVTLEQLQAALEQQKEKLTRAEAEQTADQDGKKARKPRKEKRVRKEKAKDAEGKKEKKSVTFKFSILWILFGVIGMGTVGVYVLKIVFTLLCKLTGEM